jgi:hypothetical protein
MSSSLMHGYAIMERRDDGDYAVTFRGLNGSMEMEDLDFTLAIPRGPRVQQNSPTLPPVDYPTATAPPSFINDTERPTVPPTTATSGGTRQYSFSVVRICCIFSGSLLVLLNALFG